MLPWGFAMMGCPGTGAPDGGVRVGGPTWHQDVAPIVLTRCAGCHHAGGPAAFPLTTYAEAAATAEAIAAAAMDRAMPPFNLDNSGDCNTWVDARWLSDAEIGTLADWARAGAPEGEPVDPPPEAPPPWALDRVDLTLAMTAPYTPDAALDDDYRCFVLDPGLTEQRWVTGFQVRLGAPALVHHVTLFALDRAEDDDAARALDEADPGLGYTCFGDTIVPSRWLVGTGPGVAGNALPDGTGTRMAAGRLTVLQVHYNLAAGAAPDLSAVDLRLEPDVPHETAIERVAATDLALPPGEPEVEASAELTLGGGHVLWGVWPHMHDLGTRLEITASGVDGERCLARVDDWAFHWQGFAFYTEPIALHEGDTVRIRCTWDTTSRDTVTHWGPGTADEMCIGFFYVTSR